MALSTNLDGYYKLESDGSDSVGTLGTASGTAPTYTTGKIGNCGSFASASSQYLETSAFVGGSSWTFSIWYNATTIPSSHSPICRDLVSGSNRCWNLSFSATQATLYGWNASSSFYQTTSTNHGMSTGSWYHWAGKWDATNNKMSLFLNGILFASVTTSGNAQSSSVKLSIGRQGDATSYANAKLDEIGVWSKALSDDEIKQVFNSGRGNAYPLTDTPSLYGAIAYWKFDESSGNASDVIGYRTLTNNGTTGYSAGKINNSADFGSTNTTKWFNHNSLFGFTAPTNPISGSCWVNITTAPSGSSEFAWNMFIGETTGGDWKMFYNDTAGTKRIYLQNDGSGSINYTTTLTTGTWYHLAFTFSGVNTSGSTKYYLNGTEVVNGNLYGTVDYSAYTDVFTVGANRNGTSNFMTGLVDEVGMWNRELSSTEIATLYASGAGLAYPWETASSTQTNALSFGHFA